MIKSFKLLSVILLCITLQGCVAKIVGTTVDVAIEAAKVPFKVGGAVIDVATGSGKKKKSSKKDEDDLE